MKTVKIPDSELMTAQLPEGHHYWSAEAIVAWLAARGVQMPFRQTFDPATRTHTYEMEEE